MLVYIKTVIDSHHLLYRDYIETRSQSYWCDADGLVLDEEYLYRPIQLLELLHAHTCAPTTLSSVGL